MPKNPRAVDRNGERKRCPWAGDDPLAIAYHDQEWGVPAHDDRALFEFLILEGAQAGLSWNSILRKRESYRKAFAAFDPEKVARFGQARIDRLIEDPGIVRNRLKIRAAVSNAGAFLQVQREFGTFDRYLWSFTGGQPIRHRRLTLSDVPASTPHRRPSAATFAAGASALLVPPSAMRTCRPWGW